MHYDFYFSFSPLTLQSDGIGSAIGVMDRNWSWLSDAPLVPDLFLVVEPPKVKLDSVALSQLDRDVQGEEDREPAKHA